MPLKYASSVKFEDSLRLSPDPLAGLSFVSLTWLTLSAIAHYTPLKSSCCLPSCCVCGIGAVPHTVSSLLFLKVNPLPIVTEWATSPMDSCLILSSPVLINVKTQLYPLKIHWMDYSSSTPVIVIVIVALAEELLYSDHRK
jgi:hypothetical protein